MRILRRADYPAIRWKNGRGIAYQIAAHPAAAGYDDFDWQVSRPEIAQDGPFSSFPGLDRQFMLISGAGLTLRCRGESDGVALDRVIDRPLDPFAFRGEWDVECRLRDGPVQVFNVMTRRGQAGARVEVCALSPPAAAPIPKTAGDTLLVYVARGPIDAWGAWGKAVLGTDDSLLVDEPDASEIVVGAASGEPGAIVVVRLHTEAKQR